MRRKKVYLLYFDWENTHGNHAGMAYLVNYLNKEIPEVHALRLISSEFKILRIFNFPLMIFFAFFFKFYLKTTDKVILMEFLARSSFQDYFSYVAKKIGCKFAILGIVHLAGNHLIEIYNSETRIKNKLSSIDDIIVLGSSLKSFLINVGVQNNIIQTFHYVDYDYYVPMDTEALISENGVSIICMGTLKRDFSVLKEIIGNLPEITFHICMGKHDLRTEFSKFTNVVLYSFLKEEELLKLMQKVDISLSVMKDTIGSNVIVTSMACGLVQVVSDVGSIRDYCSNEDSIFCSEISEYCIAIKNLSSDKILLSRMKENARFNAKQFCLPNFSSWFKQNIL